MDHRPDFKLRLADGRVLKLGRRTAVMGIINLTPDSFSDGGHVGDLAAVVDRAGRMAQAGADIVDVGGESTRPGARPVEEAEEVRRVVPAVQAIKAAVDITVSVDTRKAGVAQRALDAGADMVNDVSALGDPAMLPLLRERRAPVVLMHMRGRPTTMQRNTEYEEDLVATVRDFLAARVKAALSGGLSDDKILVDPGIGFGKSAAGSLEILRRLPEFGSVEQPILIGASRKNFIGAALGLPVDDRLEGSLAVAAYASARGAHVIRAHDVAETVRTVRMIDAVRDPGWLPAKTGATAGPPAEGTERERP